MVSNFEVLMDFKNVRDFAICMSKNNICCHKDCIVEVPLSQVEEECRRCWLDFLTSDEGLDLSYLEVKESIESKWSPIKLSKRSMEILENKKKE